MKKTQSSLLGCFQYQCFGEDIFSSVVKPENRSANCSGLLEQGYFCLKNNYPGWN